MLVLCHCTLLVCCTSLASDLRSWVSRVADVPSLVSQLQHGVSLASDAWLGVCVACTAVQAWWALCAVAVDPSDQGCKASVNIPATPVSNPYSLD